MNLTGLRRQSFGDPVPIRAGHRLTVRGDLAGTTVRAVVAGSTPDSATVAAGTTVILPEIGLFEVLVLA